MFARDVTIERDELNYIYVTLENSNGEVKILYKGSSFYIDTKTPSSIVHKRISWSGKRARKGKKGNICIRCSKTVGLAIAPAIWIDAKFEKRVLSICAANTKLLNFNPPTSVSQLQTYFKNIPMQDHSY
ncbi:hypothetical protein I3843_01G270500 [Carya illinoinensis]|nr:hypothetical protein I3843_01G270500 [Carya illinoinensis]